MIVRNLLLLFAAAVVFALPATASADVITFQAPVTAPNAGNGGPRQVDLDHHRAYTWRIDGVNLGGQTLTGANASFRRRLDNGEARRNRAISRELHDRAEG